MSEDKQLYAQLARYMDLKAYTAKNVGKAQAEKLRIRRDINNKRAKAAIRFFKIPDNFKRLQDQIEREQIND